MGRPTSVRLTFYAGAAVNAVLWLMVLVGPLGNMRSVNPSQSMPVLAVTVCALVGTGAVVFLLLDQIHEHPMLAGRVLSTFSSSMLAYTLVFWAGKSALAGMVAIPDTAQWIVRVVAAAAVIVGVRRLRLKPRVRVLVAAIVLLPVLVLSAFDLVLLAVSGMIGSVGSRWARDGHARDLAWAIGIATGVSGAAAAVMLVGNRGPVTVVAVQAVVVVTAVAIQANAIHILVLVERGMRTTTLVGQTPEKG